MPRRKKGQDFVAEWWLRWLVPQLASLPSGTSRRAICAKMDNKISPARFTYWEQGKTPPTPDTAFKIGEAMLDLGSSTSAGPFAALAAGGVRDLLRFLPRLAVGTPAEAVIFYAIAPVMSRLTADYSERRNRLIAANEPLLPEDAWELLVEGAIDRTVLLSRDLVREAWKTREKGGYDPSGAAAAALAAFDVLVAKGDPELAWRTAWSVMRGWAIATDRGTFTWMHQIYNVSYLDDWILNMLVVDRMIDTPEGAYHAQTP